MACNAAENFVVEQILKLEEVAGTSEQSESTCSEVASTSEQSESTCSDNSCDETVKEDNPSYIFVLKINNEIQCFTNDELYAKVWREEMCQHFLNKYYNQYLTRNEVQRSEKQHTIAYYGIHRHYLLFPGWERLLFSVSYEKVFCENPKDA